MHGRLRWTRLMYCAPGSIVLPSWMSFTFVRNLNLDLKQVKEDRLNIQLSRVTRGGVYLKLLRTFPHHKKLSSRLRKQIL